jgi:hypothetical protein
VDRARTVIQLSEDEIKRLGWTEEERRRWLTRYTERSLIAERAVAAFFLAVGTFVLDCLSIAVDRYFAYALTWLPVSLTIIGMFLMLSGAYCMVLESRLASLQIREEIQNMAKKRSEAILQ